MTEERAIAHLKRLFVGRPIPSFFAHNERLTRTTGLAVLSSDALSSVAYATEEVLRVLVVAGIGAMSFSKPIAWLIATLLAVVVFSYRQTIYAYPSGGGAYIVAKENLGPNFGLTAAAALLIDYTLTVAVSISAGVAAITSAFPTLHINRVELSLIFLAILMLGNLRGIRESGRLFGGPVYVFVTTILLLVAVGVWRVWFGAEPAVRSVEPLPVAGTHALTLFMLLTAFANGCTAMTGVEAVSNGVPAFKPPESRNAAATLVMMAALAIFMFVGISYLAAALRIQPTEAETVISQIARAVFGGGTPLYYLTQFATTLILVLAANTAFADFPRLSSVVARDRYMPRQFMNVGDKLAFSNGIIALSAAAAVLLVLFGGDTHALIPLYMIGVFLSFTLSQAGMVNHWRRDRTPGWRASAVVNGIGAVVTAIVLVIVGITKGVEGAWIVMLFIPVLVFIFIETKAHYDSVARQLAVDNIEVDTTPRKHVVIVPIGGVQRAVVEALRYASSLSKDVRAVYVNVHPEAMAELRNTWPKWGSNVKLVVLQSPFRSINEPLLEYIDRLQADRPDDYVTVVLPEFVPKRWWHHALHNQSALLLKTALLFRPHVVSTSVPFHLAE